MAIGRERERDHIAQALGQCVLTNEEQGAAVCIDLKCASWWLS